MKTRGVGADATPEAWHHPPKVIVYQRLGARGALVNVLEPLGNVFRSVPGQTTSPIWAFDDPKVGDPKGRTLLFTCPKSAIPAAVWDLLGLWNECRLVGMAPVAGGWLDQPAGVRLAFPLFSAEFQTLQRRTGASGSEQTAVMVAGTMIQALFGGKGKGR